MKDKPLKYWIRAEIEEIIKEKSVDRKFFYEYSKTKYRKVINEFYYAFVDYEKHPRVELSYCWLHFREEHLPHIVMMVGVWFFMKNSNGCKTFNMGILLPRSNEPSILFRLRFPIF